jgi:hypothetical protein
MTAVGWFLVGVGVGFVLAGGVVYFVRRWRRMERLYLRIYDKDAEDPTIRWEEDHG